LECELAPVVIHERADFRAASVAARSANELDPASKASAEIDALFSWLSHQLALSPTRKKHEART
jgi:hypothetical protein